MSPRWKSKAALLASLGLLAFAGIAGLSGCAGPSKSRLRVLLSECRQSNREHLRLLNEYDAIWPQSGLGEPEQLHGAAELGLGGF